jgi:shikimate kinase
MILRLKRTPGIYIVGFMASGKSTLGRMLAAEIGWNFVDLDDEIERRAGVAIATLFDSRGEANFRKLETEMLAEFVRAIERGRPCVVSLGGGAFAEPGNFQLLENNGVSIYLDCPLPILETRVRRNPHRPLARDLDRFRELYARRAPAYAKADYRIEVGEAEAPEHLRKLLALPLFHK